ncbi:unnamed protein product [Vitrella brassicaformis CCMP3155]|uniref:Uncharacterized protein n=1 Tax=Vitrella brassicaformis (strain CCMP3155) TaxID=1169540 RepID=A0A0G4GN46_VITBC|nr:unnamed protein product [Vitrella brassicaformis CCMP3155]|eukprot:CEM31621.1 unnamed protein product [Vitrella brassicaformis CCMP3155]
MRSSVAPPSSPAGSGGETKASQPVSTARATPKGLFLKLNPIRVPSMAMASRKSIASHMRIGDQLGAIVNVEDFLEETESEAIALSMRHGDSAHAAASCRARSIRADSQPSTSQPDAISMTSTATPSHVPTSPARNRGNVTFFPADAKGVEKVQESVVQTFRRRSLVQLVEYILLPFMVLLLALALGYFVFETVQRARGSYYCYERNIKGWDMCVLKTWPLLGPLFTLQLPCNCVYLDAKEPSEPSADRLNHAIEFLLHSRERQTHLRYLMGGRSELQEVPEGLRKLQNLEFVFLGFSRISQLPEWIEDLPAVRVIDLRVNDISSIPHSVVKLRDDLDCLLLHANPICFGTFFRDPSHPTEFIHPCGVELTDAWTSECLNLCEVAHSFFLHLDADVKRQSFVEAINMYQSEMDDCASWWTFMLFATVGATDCARCAWALNQ